MFGIDNLSPIASLIFGVLVIILPKFLNYLVGIYLIIIGFLGLGIVK